MIDALKNPNLVQLRTELAGLDALMKQGIFREDDTGRTYFTGYSYKTLYDWDSYFEGIVQLYMGWSPDLIKNSVLIFLDHQQESGFIARSVPSNEFHSGVGLPRRPPHPFPGAGGRQL